MNKLHFLNKLLNGIEIKWIALGKATKYEQPTSYLVASKNYDNEHKTPVLTAGKTFILGYTDEKVGIYKASDKPVIIFDDFTTANKWVDFDFKVKSSAIKMITSSDDSKFLLKYIYYWLNSLPDTSDQSDHKRQWIGNYANKLVPIPCPDNPEKSLAIQNKIVGILDKFTELTAELTTGLTTELTTRKKQYEYYRDQLLEFKKSKINQIIFNQPYKPTNNLGSDNIEYKKIIEFSRVLRGKRLTKNLLDNEGKYPVFHGGIEPLGFFDNFNRKENTVMVINVGASAGSVGFCDQKFWSSDGCFCLEHSEIVDNKYLYFAVSQQESYLKSHVRVAGIPTLHNSVLENLVIPIPPLPVQKRIARILDNFETLTNSITEGLPHEIALREKQYEYYRDLLFSFPKPQEVA